MKLAASFSKREAREILQEIFPNRAKRKRGEPLAPAEESLLEYLTLESEKKKKDKNHDGFVCLAISLGIYPIPNWWSVKKRMFPKYEYKTTRSWFTAEHLLQVTRETR